MDRRAFIGAMGCGLLASTHADHAQNASIPVIGFLCGQSLGLWAPFAVDAP
jgi:hypothetical protein